MTRPKYPPVNMRGTMKLLSQEGTICKVECTLCGRKSFVRAAAFRFGMGESCVCQLTKSEGNKPSLAFVDRTGEIVKGLRVLQQVDDHIWQVECIYCGRQSTKDLKSLRRGVRIRNAQPSCTCGLWKDGTFLHVDAAFVRKFLPAIKAAIYNTLKYPGKLENIAKDCLQETVLNLMTTKFKWPQPTEPDYEHNMTKVVSTFATNVAFRLSRQKDLLFVPPQPIENDEEPYDVLLNSITDGHEERSPEEKYLRMVEATDVLDPQEREFATAYVQSDHAPAPANCRMARLRRKLRTELARIERNGGTRG